MMRREILIQAGWNQILTATAKFLEAMGYQVFDSVIDALTADINCIF
jgi:hypothetical protein